MSEENQIVVPPSFIALFVEPGRTKPNATREAITARYEFCEALATLLVERAQTLQWQLGITEADVLDKLHAGLRGPDAPVADEEGEWILRRLAELLRM
ncbi:MAG: ATPase with chaperone activity [Burkholderiaceae bacterium]